MGWGRSRPVEVKEVRYVRVAGELRKAESERLIDARAVHGEVRRQANPRIVPRGFCVPLIREIEPEGGGRTDRLERQARSTLELLGKLAADRIDDVDLSPYQRGQTRRFVRYHPEHQPSDTRGLAPILVEGLENELDPWRERNKLVGPCTNRCLFEPVVADLLDVLLGYNPAGPGGTPIKGQEVWPGLL